MKFRHSVAASKFRLEQKVDNTIVVQIVTVARSSPTLRNTKVKWGYRIGCNDCAKVFRRRAPMMAEEDLYP